MNIRYDVPFFEMDLEEHDFENMLYLGGCSWVGGDTDIWGDRNGYSKEDRWSNHITIPKLKVFNDGFPGRSNPTIYRHALHAMHRGVKNMFIWWSTAERSQHYEIKTTKKHTNPHPVLEPTNKDVLEDWFDTTPQCQAEYLGQQTYSTMQYIYSLQELAKAWNVNLKMAITQSHEEVMYWDQFLNTGLANKIKHSNIINWPDKVNFENNNPVWMWWSGMLAVRYGVDRGVLKDDLQHLNKEGHIMFAKDFEEFWCNNRKIKQLSKEKDIISWLDKYSSANSKLSNNKDLDRALRKALNASSTGLRFVYET